MSDYVDLLIAMSLAGSFVNFSTVKHVAFVHVL
jgi:hypothetical protein